MGQILVVDSDPRTSELVRACLKDRGHGVVSAPAGERALEMSRETNFDLVLLDVILPGMHGFETARRLRMQPGSSDVSIMFVSSLADQSSRNLGLRMGADFLTKPIDTSELQSRVVNLLAEKTIQTTLAQKNAELVELDRFKEELSTLIVHDLKNPIGIIQSNLQYLQERIEGGDADMVDAIRESFAAGRRAMRLLGNLLDMSRIENNRVELRRSWADVSKLLTDVAELRVGTSRTRQATIAVDCPVVISAYCDRDMVERVVENVLDNALRYVPQGGRIELTATKIDRVVQIRIGNSGPPIPVEERRSVFDKFRRIDGTNPYNRGLGLYFCRLAAEAHGGRIFVEETSPLPTVFVIELPPPKDDAE